MLASLLFSCLSAGAQTTMSTPTNIMALNGTYDLFEMVRVPFQNFRTKA
jgi:hypothetical protein